jgi:choloylglycine hydrolase
MKKCKIHYIAYLIIFALIGFLTIQTANACTAFVLRDKGQFVIGKNFDWYLCCGLVIVNKRNVLKTSLLKPGEQTMAWISKYGSITFNQFGREFPLGGINEAGLVIEFLMSRIPTKYPSPDSRPALNLLQWIQHQLDISGNVEELIRNCSKVRIDSKLGAHFLACDRSGNSAIIEFIDGKLVVYTGETMDTETLINDYAYSETCEYLKSFLGFGGKQVVPISRGGYLERIIKAASMIKNYDAVNSRSIVDYAFDVLNAVSNSPGTTCWSIVYDPKNLKIYFHTVLNKKIKKINIALFDFACSTPVKIMDVNTIFDRDVITKFMNYTPEANKKLVEKTVPVAVRRVRGLDSGIIEYFDTREAGSTDKTMESETSNDYITFPVSYEYLNRFVELYSSYPERTRCGDQ